MTLIERLEAATEGSFELGAEILCHLRGVRFLSVEPRPTMGNPYHMAVCAEGIGPDDRFEFYDNDPTQCMNAALTLVPEGYRVCDLMQSGHEIGKLWWDAHVCRVGHYPDDEPLDPYWANDSGKSTPALALCIAALKAREAMSND